MRTYITTTIPYVNARPHIGFALELVQADVLARYRRARGDQVRLQAGTDDNSLKNVLAARAAGLGTAEFVAQNGLCFTSLRDDLALTVDDIIRTGSDEAEFGRWWDGGSRRVHLLCKGVIRFHAAYWPAMLLSAGLPLPAELYVHDYLTAGGRNISKSGAVDLPSPAALAREYGTDALRWWLLREVPRAGDADFTIERLVARADDELANGITAQLTPEAGALPRPDPVFRRLR